MKKIIDFFKNYGHKMLTFVVGLLFIALICFGVSKVALGVFRIFKPNNIYSDSSYKSVIYGGSPFEVTSDEKAEEGSKEFFADLLSNVIIQDMPSFNDPSELSDEYLISYGLWQALTLNNNQGVYTYNKNGSFRVPASDVEQFITYTFDHPEKIKHQTVNICGRFKYNKINKTYTVSAENVDSILTPEILKVTEGEDDTYVITADIYENSTLTTSDNTNDSQNFIRRVEITMQNLGVQSYNSETGDPITRYTVLSSKTVDETENKTEVELN